MDEVWSQNTCFVHAIALPWGLWGNLWSQPPGPLSPGLICPFLLAWRGTVEPRGGRLLLASEVLSWEPCASLIAKVDTASFTENPGLPHSKAATGYSLFYSASQIHLLLPSLRLPPRPPSSFTWPQCLSHLFFQPPNGLLYYNHIVFLSCLELVP